MKQRLDLLLVQKGFASDQSQAAAMIMAGEVKSSQVALSKPGQLVDTNIELIIKSRSAYVSRGGDKLASVAGQLKLDFKDKTVLDAGASTGGFTDFALQNGATKVFAVDVGTNQLDYRLRQDDRVVVMEQTDIRDAELSEPVDIAVVDVSFVSLSKILDSVAKLLKPEGIIIAMAKPQFEADKAVADQFKGVIPEPERSQILGRFKSWAAEHFDVLAEADSGLAGQEGNIERFYKLRILSS